MFKKTLGAVLGVVLFACSVSAIAQTQSAPTNPNGVTAPTFNAYKLTLQTPLAGLYGGMGTATPYQRLTLAAGVATWTFSSAYNSIPVCVGSEEASTGHYVKITAISTSAVTFTSDVTTSNTDKIDVLCSGAPN